MTSIIYYGFPPLGNHQGFVHFIDRDDPNDKGRDLPAKHVNKAKFEWGYLEVRGQPSKAMVAGAAPLALAICCHALGSDDRGMKVYQRFKQRVMSKWPRGEEWAITAEEVAVICDQIEADELTPQELRTVDRERPAIETEYGRGVEGPIVWKTDERGQWVKPRHGGDE